MKARLFPTFATFAILALAAVAPAQERGRRGGGESRERSSPSRGSERSGPDRSRGDSRGRSEPPTRDSRPDRSRDAGPSRDPRPSGGSDRSRDSRPTDSRPPSSRDRSRDRDSRDSRPGDPWGGGSRGDSGPDRSRDSRPGDSRPGDNRSNGSRSNGSRSNEGRSNDWRDRNRGRDDSRPSRPGTPESGRRNPFDRSNGRDDRRPGGGFDGRYDGRSSNGWGRRDSARSSRPVYVAPPRYDGRGRFNNSVRFGTPPIRSVLGVQIRRADARRGPDFAFGGVFGGLRVGYVSYGSNYNRFNAGFGYRYYAYDPFAPNVVCAASPWYRYSYLPPYIDNTRVIVVNNYPSRWDWDGWNGYDERRERRDAAVQGALDDLRDAFQDSDGRYGDRLVPQDGNVAVYNDGRYDYSLNAEDFRDMFLDGIEGSQTIRYEILEVRTRGDEVRLRARHTFEDSWSSEQSVVHTLTLRRDRDGAYVIREFGSE